jgi:hypothetical protein
LNLLDDIDLAQQLLEHGMTTVGGLDCLHGSGNYNGGVLGALARHEKHIDQRIAAIEQQLSLVHHYAANTNSAPDVEQTTMARQSTVVHMHDRLAGIEERLEQTQQYMDARLASIEQQMAQVISLVLAQCNAPPPRSAATATRDQ